MADQLNFELVTPESLLVSETVDMVVVPGIEGDFGVLAGHSPLMSNVRPGIVEIHRGSEVERVFVAGGFADITPQGLTLLAEEAHPAEKLSAEVFDRLMVAAEEEVTRATGEVEVAAANLRLNDLKQMRTQSNA